MARDTRGFGSGFVEGFGLIDDYYRKNKEEARQVGRDKAADEAAAAARANDEKRLSILESQAKSGAAVDAARVAEAQAAGEAHRESLKATREMRGLAARKAADEQRAEKALQAMYRIHNGETPSDRELAELGEYNPLRFVRPEFTGAVANLTKRVTEALAGGGATTGANWDKLLDESIPDIQRVYGPRIAASIGRTINGKPIKGMVIDDIKPGKSAGSVTLEIGYETADGRRGTIERPMPLDQMMDYLQGNNMAIAGIRRDPRFTSQLAALARAYDKRPESMALLGESLAAYGDYKKRVYAEADDEWKEAVENAAKSGSPPPDRKQFIDAYTRANTIDEASFAQRFTMSAKGEDDMSAKDLRALKKDYADQGIVVTNGQDVSLMRDIEVDGDANEIGAIAGAFKTAGMAATPAIIKTTLDELDAAAPTPSQVRIATMAAQGAQPPDSLRQEAAAEAIQRQMVLKRLLKKRIGPKAGETMDPTTGQRAVPPAGNAFSSMLRS